MDVNVTVSEIKPWRFDVARNKSLDLVPIDTDICVCTDIDEVFEEGWRKKLENVWNDKVDKVKYNYHWSFDEYGNPATTFYIEKQILHSNPYTNRQTPSADYFYSLISSILYGVD